MISLFLFRSFYFFFNIKLIYRTGHAATSSCVRPVRAAADRQYSAISIRLVQKTLLILVEKYAQNMHLCTRTAHSRY